MGNLLATSPEGNPSLVHQLKLAYNRRKKFLNNGLETAELLSSSIIFKRGFPTEVERPAESEPALPL